jgi:hypothetical protein
MKLVIRKQKSLLHAGAFAIMEAIVAVGVIGVVFVSLYTAISSGFGFVQLSRENLRGTQILQEKMETIRLYTWDQITTPGFIPTNFTEYFIAATNTARGLVYTGQVTIASAPVTEIYSNDLKQVTIKLQWQSGRVLRNREMSTFVGRNGLQNYIY